MWPTTLTRKVVFFSNAPSRLTLLLPSCLLHVTAHRLLDSSLCLMAPPTPAFSRILAWLSSALGYVGEKLCWVLNFPGSCASSLSQHIPALGGFAMELVPPFVPTERLFYAGGGLRRAFRNNLNFLWCSSSAGRKLMLLEQAISGCCAGASRGAGGTLLHLAGMTVQSSGRALKGIGLCTVKAGPWFCWWALNASWEGLGGKAQIHLLWTQRWHCILAERRVVTEGV